MKNNIEIVKMHSDNNIHQTKILSKKKVRVYISNNNTYIILRIINTHRFWHKSEALLFGLFLGLYLNAPKHNT